MPIDAKTIQIFLPGGQPRGLRIAEVTTRIVQAVQVPRTHLEKAFARPELAHIGVYFLFGENEEKVKPVAYIGQTENLPFRLKQHNSEKDFWQTAVLIISKTHSFTQAHLKYLEWHCIKRAKEAGRYALDNGNEGSKPYVTEPMEADLLDTYETADTLISTLGFPVFESLAPRNYEGDGQDVFYCNGRGADARGKLVEDGFVVLQGSTGPVDMVPSIGSNLSTWRGKLMTSGIVVEEDGKLHLTEDHLFGSPSTAAGVLLGRKANGWREWKDKQGRTLDEIKRANQDGQ